MTRTEALTMWRQVAAGYFDDIETLEWLQEVAKRILVADSDPKKLGSNYRVYEITRAVGLAQKEDKNAELRRYIEMSEGFFPLEEKNGEMVDRSFRRGEEMKLLIEMARSQQLVPEEASDPEVRKRIERILKSIRKN